jgi:hypothetical protein
MLSYQDVGPAGMLSRATAGVAGDTVLFALPGSGKACALALDKLVLPNLRHLVHQIDKESGKEPGKEPANGGDSPIAPPGVGGQPKEGCAAAPSAGLPDAAGPVVEIVDSLGSDPEGRPTPPTSDMAPTGWQGGLQMAQGALLRDAWPKLPGAIERVAAAREVLDRAGDRAVVRFSDGREYAAFGFPDLRRTSSKVLLVGPGQPLGEVVALHRYPRTVGLLVAGEGGVLPRGDQDPRPVSKRITGRPNPSDGTLFAVDVDAVYVLREGEVWRWDGRRETPFGTAIQALATLVLGWSQR